MKIVVNNFEYKNECYVIVENDGWYMPIDKKDIDKEGKLTRCIRGGHKTIKDAIQYVMDMIDVRELTDNGMDETEAIIKVCFRKVK